MKIVIIFTFLAGSLCAQMSMRGDHQDYIAESALQLLEDAAEKYAIIDTSLRYVFMEDIREAYENCEWDVYYNLLNWYRQLLHEVNGKRSYISVYLLLQRQGYLPHKTFRELANESKNY